MKERRKLNDVFVEPQTKGFFTICGVIGSGKTKERVVLQKTVPKDEVNLKVVCWKHNIGKLWKNIDE